MNEKSLVEAIVKSRCDIDAGEMEYEIKNGKALFSCTTCNQQHVLHSNGAHFSLRAMLYPSKQKEGSSTYFKSWQHNINIFIIATELMTITGWFSDKLMNERDVELNYTLNKVADEKAVIENKKKWWNRLWYVWLYK